VGWASRVEDGRVGGGAWRRGALYSDPPLGRYDWTCVINVTTGEEQPHVYNSERVPSPRGLARGTRSRGG